MTKFGGKRLDGRHRGHARYKSERQRCRATSTRDDCTRGPANDLQPNDSAPRNDGH